MTVFYKKYQLKNSTSRFNGKWYARAVQTETVDINTLADEMEQNCTLKRADIVAVLSELSVTMKRHLQASHRVKLDRLGSFKIGVTTKPANNSKDFNVTDNVKGLHIIFMPETKIAKDKSRSRVLLDGCNVAELPKNAIVDEEEADGATDSTSQNSGESSNENASENTGE